MKKNEEYIKQIETENIQLKDSNQKLSLSHNELRKTLEGLIKQIKPESQFKATDEQIINSWNNGIPKESATKDIVIALRGSRATMNAIMLQGLNELSHILDQGKKDKNVRKENKNSVDTFYEAMDANVHQNPANLNQ